MTTKLTIAFFLTLLVASGQAVLTPTASAANARAGQQITVTVTLANPGAPIAALEWTLGIPAGWTSGAPAATSALTGIQKQLSCAGPLCVAWGLNLTAVPGAALATIPVTIPANASAGPAQISLGSLIASTPSGIAAPLSAGSAVSITVLSKFDIDGDGKVSGSDVQAVLSQVLGAQACSADLDGDTKCTPLDLVLEVAAWISAGSLP